MDLTSVYAIATAIGVIVLALTEVMKKAFNIKKRWIPLTAFILGMVIGLAAAPIHEATVAQLLWGGGIAGLVASGAFDTAKNILVKREEEDDGKGL